MKTIIKSLFFLFLLGFVCLSIYALIGDMNADLTEYNVEVELDKN